MPEGAAVIWPDEAREQRAIAAVITICSKRKRITQSPSARAASLPTGKLTAVAARWLKELSDAPKGEAASKLYAGRAFALARSAADQAAAPLYVISAGLGLVASETPVPSYALTVAGAGEDAIGPRVEDSFKAAQWFDAVLGGPYSVGLDRPFQEAGALVLVALTRAYAGLVGDALSRLPATDKSRLRIFGTAVEDRLPRPLHRQIMPYDGRLESVFPGTQADFAQRALADFATTVALQNPRASAEEHATAVSTRLEGRLAPPRPQRLRRTDSEILELIKLRAASSRPVSLRALRDEEGIACEQGRFGRLMQTFLAVEAG